MRFLEGDDLYEKARVLHSERRVVGFGERVCLRDVIGVTRGRDRDVILVRQLPTR